MAYIEREVERSVPELKIGNLLTRKEIRQIIKERTYFADRKFKFSKHDFLRYIEFEAKLFKLVMLRTQSRKNLSEDDIYSIRKRFISRINTIYNHALNSYSNDRQLWLKSFDFAKRYSERISRAKFLKALLLHPNWIDAWIEAAKYEFEWNKNPSNARLLYQRAISLNKKSMLLYLSFFEMEINVIKQHLNWNFKETEKTDNIFDWKKQLNAMNKNKDEWIERVYSEMEVPKLILRYALKNIEGKLKYLVIKRLLLLIPTMKDLQNDLTIHKGNQDEDELNEKYDQIIQRFGELKQYIFEYLEKHYYFDSVIIQILALKNIQIYSKNNTVMNRSVEIAGAQVFERAMLLLSTEKEKQKNKKHIVDILNNYMKYLKNRVDFHIKRRETIANESDLYTLDLYKRVTQYLMLRLIDSFQRLQDLSMTNAEILQDWIMTLTQMDKWDDALDLVKVATKQYPDNVLLWTIYSNLHCRQLAVVEESKQRNEHYRKAIAACLKGIQCVSISDAPMLWINMIDIMIAQLSYLSLDESDSDNTDIKDDSDSDSDVDMMDDHPDLMSKQIDAIHKVFRRGIQQCLSNNDGIKEHYLKWSVMYHSQDKTKILDVLKWFDAQTMKCSPNIYKCILDIYKSILLFDIQNMNRLSNIQQANIDKVSRMYEKCVNEHGKTKSEVWSWYIEYARKYMKLSVASAIHQRAMKTLNSEGLQMFLQQCNVPK